SNTMQNGMRTLALPCHGAFTSNSAKLVFPASMPVLSPKPSSHTSQNRRPPAAEMTEATDAVFQRKYTTVAAASATERRTSETVERSVFPATTAAQTVASAAPTVIEAALKAILSNTRRAAICETTTPNGQTSATHGHGARTRLS